MEVKNFTPYIRVAMDSKIESNFYFNRAIFDHEIIYLKEGELLAKIGEETYHCTPGDIIFLRPQQNHMLKTIKNSPIHQPHIHFDFYYQEDSPNVKVSFKKLNDMSKAEMKWLREDITRQWPVQIPSVIRLRNPIIIENILYEIINEFDQKLPFYELNIQGLFSQLWSHLSRESHWQKNEQLHKYLDNLQNVKAYLSHHINREVSLQELGEMSNLSKYHLLRLFKEAYKVTPIKYHLEIRVEKAKELIQYSNLPITEIAAKFGFHSVHSFSRSFKNIEGVPPTFYRKKGF
ncbi:AraC family transcriptional regulator [Bacillus sp. SA1-12]|uniref:helix-turn-helix domain-containing protein n=1 Tax=Bacillus sp. SA1-12 TaxID=1455638 RepID=UPI0006274241|nr:AraC family transcriptional regulator [Bacillus sp. SA1-12]KKI90057.1 AraC family transcriptional regulator [Bacillus sp. SA1-12]